MGEFFVEYDEPTGYWCIFHTERKAGFAFKSFLTEQQAEDEAKELNLWYDSTKQIKFNFIV